MKSQFFYLLGILLTFIVGTLLHYFFCCTSDQISTANDQTIIKEKIVDPKIDNKIVDPEIENKIIDFEVAEKNDPEKEVCDDVFEKPFVLNFQSGQADINLNSAQKEAIDLIAKCANELGTALTITGHTDNTGREVTNLRVGQQRADAIKALLVEKGVAENLIITESKGEEMPIESNGSEEGKEKNRRIEIKAN